MAANQSRHAKHLARGFNWLGGATIIAKITDFAAILVVLLYLTKAQMGLGSLLVSLATIVEAFDGMGTGDALVQAKRVSAAQMQSLFWFILASATALGALTLAAAPLFEHLYGTAGLFPYFAIIALKQPLVGAAVIPLSRLNRALRYERIALINVTSTLGAAFTRLGLALAGFGAWALVGGYVASGVFILASAWVFSPIKLSFRFHWPEIAPLVRFGAHSATSNIFEQVFKNIDYLLVGWFYGPANLAVYRVAFDVAMEPAMAIGTIINRTALPVFARAGREAGALKSALLWSLERVCLLNAPLMTALYLAATPLMGLLHDRNGASYAAAAWPLKIFAIAAILRIASQLLYPLLTGTGRPQLTARLSATTFVLLSAGILTIGFTLPAYPGLIAVAGLWLAIYPGLLVWGGVYAAKLCTISLPELLTPFKAPGLAVAGVIMANGVLGLAHPTPWVKIAVILATTGLAYTWLINRAKRQAA